VNFGTQSVSDDRRDGHGILGSRALPSSLKHVLDICFIGDPVCDDKGGGVGTLAHALLSPIHTAYGTFGDDGVAPLTTLIANITAGMLEKS
jgi:hypothetical protein